MSSAARPETVPNFRRPASRGWAGRDAGDRFSICLERLFAHEGGFNNLKADRGGATNFGISLRFLAGEAAMNPAVRDLLRRLVPGYAGPVTADTIRGLTAQAAAFLYLWCFWAPSHCDRLPHGVDGMVFDQAVNGGRTTGVRLLQRAINRTHRAGPLLEDGQMGPRTLDAAARVGFLDLRAAFRAVAAERYVAIVEANPSQRKFLRGWLVRAAALGDV
jgi:lysozyme family protein